MASGLVVYDQFLFPSQLYFTHKNGFRSINCTGNPFLKKDLKKKVFYSKKRLKKPFKTSIGIQRINS